MKKIKQVIKITLTSLIAALACTGIIYAATTVGTNISTTGTLTATGLTTLGRASSTLLSISGTTYIGGASGLVLADGSITDASGTINFGDENLITSGNLNITGTSTLATTTISGSGEINITPNITQVAQLTLTETTQGKEFWDMSNGIIYAVDMGIGPGDGFITVIDVSDPENPIERVTKWQDANFSSPSGLRAVGNYLYVSDNSGSGWFHIIDATNPQNLIWKSRVVCPSVHLDVQGNYAYAIHKISGTDIFYVFDVTDPTAPYQISATTLTDVGGDNGMYVSGGYAYIANGDNDKIIIVDITNPAIPSITKTIQNGVGILSSYGAGTGMDRPEDLFVINNLLYVAGSESDTVLVFDISDRTTPTLLDTLTDATYLDGIQVVGGGVADDFIYLINGSSGHISIVDVRNPNNISLYSTTAISGMSGNAQTLLYGDYLFTLEISGSQVFTVLDVGGIEANAIRTGSLYASRAEIGSDLNVGNRIDASGGINSGKAGIHTDGGISASATSTFRTGIGIGTSTPAVELEVNGLIKSHQSASTTCSGSIVGSIFYNTANDSFWGCKSTGWQKLDN